MVSRRYISRYLDYPQLQSLLVTRAGTCKTARVAVLEARSSARTKYELVSDTSSHRDNSIMNHWAFRLLVDCSLTQLTGHIPAVLRLGVHVFRLTVAYGCL